MGLLSGGQSDDEDLDELEGDEGDEEDDDVAPRSKKKSAPKVSAAARVRELVDAGVTTVAELLEDIGADAKGRVQTALSALKRDGVIRATGVGTFERIGAKPKKVNGGGQTPCRASGAREGRFASDRAGTLYGADRRRRGRVLERGRRRGARASSREIVT